MLDKLRKSPTIIALAVTAFAYLLGYTYQSAYLKYYEVSAYEVEVSVNNLIIASIGIFFVLFAIDQIAVLYRAFLWEPDSNKPSNRYIRMVLKVGATLLVTLAYLESINISDLMPFVVGSAVVFVLFAIEPLWSLKKGKGITQALEEMYKKKDTESKDPEKYNTYFEKYGVFIRWGLLLYALASIGGYIHASLLPQLYIYSEKDQVKELIVLKNGDTFVTKRYNVDTHEFEPGYTVQKIQDKLVLDKMQQIK